MEKAGEIKARRPSHASPCGLSISGQSRITLDSNRSRCGGESFSTQVPLPFRTIPLDACFDQRPISSTTPNSTLTGALPVGWQSRCTKILPPAGTT